MLTTQHVRSSGWIRRRLAVAVAMALLGGCGSVQPSRPPSASQVAGSPSAAPSAAEPGPLEDALTLVPAGTTQIYFTDWAQLETEAGFGGATSKGSEEELARLVRAFNGDAVNKIPPQHSPSLSPMVPYLLQMAEDWGFDMRDVAWEAAIVGVDVPSADVVRLADRFDVRELRERFVERGFQTEIVRETTVYTADFSNEWVMHNPLFANVAILPDAATLVFAVGRPALQPILEATQLPPSSAGAAASLLVVAQGLDRPTAAILAAGEDICNSVESSARSWSDVIRGEVEGVGALHPYGAWGIGYTHAHDPIGRMVFVYANAADGRADFEGRQSLLATGHSVRGPRTYADYFSVGDAALLDRSLTFELEPASGSPRVLFLGFPARDMTYATC